MDNEQHKMLFLFFLRGITLLYLKYDILGLFKCADIHVRGKKAI